MAQPDAGRGLAHNTLWSLANEGLTLVTAMLSVLLLIPRLGPGDYGAYAGLFALMGPFAAFSQSGVTLTVLEHTVGADEHANDVVRSCLSIAGSVALGLAPVVVLLGALFIHRLSVATLAVFVTTELIVQAGLLVVIATVQGARKFSTGIALRLVIQLIRILVLVGLVVTDRLTLPHLAVTSLAMFGLFAVVLFSVAPRLGVGAVRPGRIDRRHIKSSFLYSVGLSASITQNDGDKVVLNASGHDTDAGVYAAAYRVVSIGMVPLAAFTSSTHFAVLRSARDTDDQVQRAVRFTKFGAIYAIPAMLMIIVAAPLVPVVLGDAFDGVTTMLRWLSPVLVLRGLAVFPMNGLLGLGRNRLRSLILVGNALLSVALYIALVPSLSWRGAVIATLISETTLFLSGWVGLLRSQRAADRSRGSLDLSPDLTQEAL